jgi:hypothetical protein
MNMRPVFRRRWHEHLAAPGCARVGSQWDRCGVHYVHPIG